MSVFNPAVFIGEAVAGATAGAPLATDANGNLVSGINAIEVSATATATTTSGTAAIMTGMTITATAGTYLFIFSTAINSTDAGATITVGAFNNGTVIAQSVRAISPFDGGALSAANASGVVAINGLVTITTGAFTIQWQTTGGTASSGPRTLNLIRLS